MSTVLTVSLGQSNTGLLGSLGFTLLNPDDTVYQARTTTGILELGYGNYTVSLTLPNQNLIVYWDASPGSPISASSSLNSSTSSGITVADIWNEVVPDSFPAGSAGYALGSIMAGNIIVTSPLSADMQTLTLTQYTDYAQADGREILFTDTGNVFPVQVIPFG